MMKMKKRSMSCDYRHLLYRPNVVTCSKIMARLAYHPQSSFNHTLGVRAATCIYSSVMIGSGHAGRKAMDTKSRYLGCRSRDCCAAGVLRLLSVLVVAYLTLALRSFP